MLIDGSFEHQILPVPFYSLTLSGIWCPNNIEPRLRRIYGFFTYCVIIFEIVLTTEIVIYLITIVCERQFELDAFFVMTSLMNGLYKTLSILSMRKNIESLLMKGFGDCWRIPRNDFEKKMLNKYSNESLRIHFVYTLACLLGVSIKLVGPMMKPHTDIELPSAAWYPYNTNKSFYFWTSYFQQIAVGGMIILTHIGADTMLAGFMLQTCIQLQLLKYRLRNFPQDCTLKDRNFNCLPDRSKLERVLMKQYIKDHQFIYSFAKKLNTSFSGFLIAMLTVVVPNICINVYFLSFSEIGINVDFITSLGLFSISLFQIYLPCWYGNEVMIHSMEIGNAILEMDWIDLTLNSKKALMMIMIRSSKPIQLTAAHVIPMNIKSFLSIMKTSYSVLSLMQRTRIA